MMRKKKSGPVGIMINKLNHVGYNLAVLFPGNLLTSLQHFFHPRKMEIILARGQTRLSGEINILVPRLHPVALRPHKTASPLRPPIFLRRTTHHLDLRPDGWRY